MKEKESVYIIETKSNGERKIYRAERFILVKRLKFAGAMIAAVAVMLLFCGMALVEDGPIMPFQVVLFAGFGLMVLISLIYSYVSYKEPWEKQGGNKNLNFRRKTR